MEMAETVGEQFLQAVGYDRNGPDPRAIDSKVIFAAEKILLSKPLQSFGPTEDGTLVKEDIAAGFGAGRQNRIPLIIGSNEDETGFGSEPDFNKELGLTGASVDELRRFYPEASRNLAELAARLCTDSVARELADALGFDRRPLRASRGWRRSALTDDRPDAGGSGECQRRMKSPRLRLSHRPKGYAAQEAPEKGDW
jgi:para-nitrobenzyl esterase